MAADVDLSREELLLLVRELRAALTAAQATASVLSAEVEALRSEVEALRAEVEKKGDPPSWTKPNTPAREATPRKVRDHGAGRRHASEPDAEFRHAVDVCPDCGHALSGGWEDSRRESLVFPREPVRVIHHVCVARRCGHCGRVVVGRPATHEHGLVGRSRVDARGMSLIAYWHIVCRIPLRAIQQMLARLHGLHLSLGGLRGILDAVAERGRPDYAHLKVEIRGSPAVHADESPWRENGSNGYVWACATDAIRYFERHGTRSGSVPRALLGDTFSGVVVCDGYVGYNTLDCRLQRCWVHLLRHGHEITARNPAATRAHAWVRALRALYDAATALVATPGYASRPEATRAKYRLRFEARLMKLAQRVCPTDPKPMVNLAKFLAGKVNECFVFVELPEVAGENNAAERAIRPLVVTRKVCGGTRSAKGSETKMVLASLLHTLLVRQTDPVAAVEQMLLGTPLFAPRA